MDGDNLPVRTFSDDTIIMLLLYPICYSTDLLWTVNPVQASSKLMHLLSKNEFYQLLSTEDVHKFAVNASI